MYFCVLTEESVLCLNLNRVSAVLEAAVRHWDNVSP